MITEQELNKGMTTLKSLWFALFASLMLYVLGALQIKSSAHTTFSPEAYNTLRLILFGVAFVTLVVTWYVRKHLLSTKVAAKAADAANAANAAKSTPHHPAVARYTTIMITAMGLSEAIGIYGFILYILGKNQIDLYLLTALAAAAMTLYYPKRQDIVELAQKM
jgi:F0F1-type ATP synthase membrane subunit c/vacuolar-type H+-ATPase subunit K